MTDYGNYPAEEERVEDGRARAQRELIEKLLWRLESRHLTREKMYKRLLKGADSSFSLTKTINRIDVLDAVRENVMTSLSFGNYRRATWYLKMLERLCRRYF